MISLQREAFFLRKRLRGFLLKAQFCDALRCLGLIARCTDARKRVCILPQKRSLKNWKTVSGALGFVLGSFLFSFFQPPSKKFSFCVVEARFYSCFDGRRQDKREKEVLTGKEHLTSTICHAKATKKFIQKPSEAENSAFFNFGARGGLQSHSLKREMALNRLCPRPRLCFCTRRLVLFFPADGHISPNAPDLFRPPKLGGGEPA